MRSGFSSDGGAASDIHFKFVALTLPRLLTCFRFEQWLGSTKHRESSSSSSSVFPARSLGFTIFGEIFCVCDLFFNPTIQVVTFRLRGWCKLGEFLFLGFTRLGHECQDILSPCDGMHVRLD